MLSEIGFNLDQSKILSSGNGLKESNVYMCLEITFNISSFDNVNNMSSCHKQHYLWPQRSDVLFV